MAEDLMREVASNCCNGRVGRELVQLAETSKVIRDMIAPTGVELVRVAEGAGIQARSYTNCCNGRVGKSAMEDVVAAMGGA